MLLSVVVDTGAQIGLSFGVVLVLAVVSNVANPMKKGEVLKSFIVPYALCGSVAGYLSSRIYKFCTGRSSDWKSNAVVTAIALPSIFGSMFIVLNRGRQQDDPGSDLAVVHHLYAFGLSRGTHWTQQGLGNRGSNLNQPNRSRRSRRPLALECFLVAAIVCMCPVVCN
jgi:hypothetical protein